MVSPEPDDIVLDFLTKYESGKESESADSEDHASVVETSQVDSGGVSGSTGTPGGMHTTGNSPSTRIGNRMWLKSAERRTMIVCH